MYLEIITATSNCLFNSAHTHTSASDSQNILAFVWRVFSILANNEENLTYKKDGQKDQETTSAWEVSK